ncbi:hypothetical protein N7495_006920 [Penicillium taxi]|uniref:uncharacterized protein n=1 Tax=Penicillium taxi TaxID=168475 RepID=UPI002544ECDC|nr:uncharacterized protein N7495_006920 [Penicillium taxi]KAJ5895229.1 hypothetical protein N7495_006920 [Penicillium taxi]
MYNLATIALGVSALLQITHASPHPISKSYTNWTTLHGHGVNLGGWLEQESTIDTAWWAKYSGGASDEWGLCENLGSKCRSVMEHRYATYITRHDIDKVASAGVSILRIPTTYAAWIELPGSQLYSGHQQRYLQKIATYAIEKYQMHIIIDLHSLPGGVNGLDIGEAAGHSGWWHNETALEWSLRAVDEVLSFIKHSGHPEAYTIEPINEPVDNKDLSTLGTPAALSDHGAAWLLKYIHAVIARVKAADPLIPVMFQGSFHPVTYWSPHFKAGTNLVFDLHHYYFFGTVTSVDLPTSICSDARASEGDGKFPTFVGEWSIQTGGLNSLALREVNLKAGISAFGQFTHGSAYWNVKFSSEVTVAGGLQEDYWNYEGFIDAGYFDGQVEQPNYCL